MFRTVITGRTPVRRWAEPVGRIGIAPVRVQRNRPSPSTWPVDRPALSGCRQYGTSR